MTAPTLDYAWRTHRGLVRARNEDAVQVQPEAGIVVVADGMGGAAAGDVASALATDTIVGRLSQRSPGLGVRDTMAETAAAVGEANETILQQARRKPEWSGMGTTIVVGCVAERWLVHAHVGDSRLYRWRDARLRQLTRDHSVIQEVVDQGMFPSHEEALAQGVNEHILTRALGGSSNEGAEVSRTELAAGDLFLFCTDGLTGMVSLEDLQQVLRGAGQDLDGAAETLVRLACDRGGIDNITVVLMRVGADGGDRA